MTRDCTSACRTPTRELHCLGPLGRAVPDRMDGRRTTPFCRGLLDGHPLSYRYPAGAEVFRPALSEEEILEGAHRAHREALLNRYRNSAHHLDAELGPWLASPELRRTLLIVTGAP